jgi:hypothetical protein
MSTLKQYLQIDTSEREREREMGRICSTDGGYTINSSKIRYENLMENERRA